jgi:hypothetical protein
VSCVRARRALSPGAYDVFGPRAVAAHGHVWRLASEFGRVLPARAVRLRQLAARRGVPHTNPWVGSPALAPRRRRARRRMMIGAPSIARRPLSGSVQASASRRFSQRRLWYTQCLALLPALTGSCDRQALGRRLSTTRGCRTKNQQKPRAKSDSGLPAASTATACARRRERAECRA